MPRKACLSSGSMDDLAVAADHSDIELFEDAVLLNLLQVKAVWPRREQHIYRRTLVLLLLEDPANRLRGDGFYVGSIRRNPDRS